MAKYSQQSLTLFIALGAGIGAAVGVARDELTFYLGIGSAIGLMVGVIVDQRNMVNREVKKGEQGQHKDDIIPKY